MHWDREWYFSTEESQVLLVNNMDEIMTMLEDNPDYPSYVLDGQTAILEDYFAAKPENFERVKHLVQQGRLKIGPWYTQTDEMIIGAESMTRNLLYGFKDSHRLGKPMMVGYVPDSFGQSAQTPMILNQFGIKRSLFWRGFTQNKGTNSSEFKWCSQDGSEVFSENFPLGYAAGKYLESNEKTLKIRMDGILSVLDKRANGQDELLPNGHDQMPIQKNIKAIIQLLNKLYPERQFKLSSYENLFKALERQSKVPVVQGEMLDGKNARIHRSIYSVRMDLKVYNARIENKITNILEPLASLAKSLGIPYQHGLIELIWKELMKNHAHDSIGGCVSDKVNKEIWSRYLIVEERVDVLTEFYKRKLTEAVNSKDKNDKLTLFNLLPDRPNELTTVTIITKSNGFELLDENKKAISFNVVKRQKIDAGIIDRQIVAHGDYTPFNKFQIELNCPVSQFGYQTLMVVPNTTDLQENGRKAKTVETDFYHINFEKNGTLSIVDKKTKQRYDGVLNIENQANDGDEYDFSPLKDDTPIFSTNLVKNARILIEEFKLSYHAKISYQLNLPKNLTERLKTDPQTAKMEFEFTLQIPKHDRTISISTKIDNQVKDQRTRILIPTNIVAKTSIADNQFGVIRRPVLDPSMKVWQSEKWNERPDTIFPFLSYVSLSDQQTVSLITNSSREYEIIGDKSDTIALTLISSVGWLGKHNLVRRPGRPSGIHAATPDAQVLTTIDLNFGIRFDEASFEESRVAEHAKSFLTPVVSYNQIPFEAMHLNPSKIKLPMKKTIELPVVKGTVISVIKQSEDDKSMLLRIYNPTSHILKISSEYEIVSLREQHMKNSLEIKPNQVQTLVVKDK